ncbi:hypothetical protein E1A91_A12G109300v1 [Gossypium mustelinum]|uniref:Secreted protein n=3 Tax=Gossypium TaxID=3633 RepID=A0A5D2WT31_GOSMU|nr:hypothetical protein ES288_A12G116400v1 [Gossypium darwinii]TYH95606.1 hypothetical protein ES332_A12G117800v1 [Gossypium tomentosum]TYJ04690.1 hypothetical protein E1A91_A12G109300v1 [Gossypium mustelinum]
MLTSALCILFLAIVLKPPTTISDNNQLLPLSCSQHATSSESSIVPTNSGGSQSPLAEFRLLSSVGSNKEEEKRKERRKRRK